MKSIYVIAPLFAAGLIAGCQTMSEPLRQPTATASTKAGAPIPYLVPDHENPDVIWFTRAVDTRAAGGDTKTMYGLFACYRGPAAAPGVKCYMAQYSWKLEDLNWPGAAGSAQAAEITAAAAPPVTCANLTEHQREIGAKALEEAGNTAGAAAARARLLCAPGTP